MKQYKVAAAKASFGHNETLGLTEAQADLRAGKVKLKKEGKPYSVYVVTGETVEFKKGELLMVDDDQPRGRIAQFEDPTDDDLAAAEKNNIAYAARKTRIAEKDAAFRKEQKKAAAARADKKKLAADEAEAKAADKEKQKQKMQDEADEKAVTLKKQEREDAEKLAADAKQREAEAAANGQAPEKQGLFQRVVGAVTGS